MAWWIFQHVVVTAALALMVAAVCRVARLGPVARHALWVIVLIKFVTPPLVAWPWAAPDPLGVAALDARPRGSRTTTGEVVVRTDTNMVADAEAGAVLEDALRDHSVARDVPPAPDTAVLPWLLALWVAGSLGVLAVEGTRVVRLNRRIRHAPPVDPSIVRRVAELSARLGLRPVPVCGVVGQSSPAVWGAGRPRLLWPVDLTAQSDTSIDGLLVHELAHVRRGDHLIGWIELAAGVVWWWNPLFWYVRSALREQAELACDAWVISALPDGRRAYAESLLTLSGAEMGRGSPVAVIGMTATSRRMLERRLVMIMQGRAPLRLTGVGVCCLGLIAAATLPVWATSAAGTPTQTPVQTTAQTPAPKVQSQVVKPVVTPQVKVTPTQDKQDKKVVVTPAPTGYFAVRLKPRPDLPAEGQQLLQSYDADEAAIWEELEKKMTARRDSLTQALKDLQETYTKAGKLDEAVAIRDFIQAGMPGLETNSRYFKLTRKK